MTVLVTGGAGFIGSHLTEYILEDTDDSVIILDDLSTGTLTNIAHLTDEDRVTFNEADLRDQAAVTNAVEKADQVYHLAAAVGVKRIVNNPLAALQTNLEGTQYILDAASDRGLPTFIASSSEVYGKSTDVPFSEESDRVLGSASVPRWGYATAKAADEYLALAYHQQTDLPVVIGRLFNIVGPRQTGEYGMVVPRFIDQAQNEDPLTVYGDGTQTRSFTHVLDAVAAIHELMHTTEADGTVFNIGSKNPVSINELAETVIERTDSESAIEHIPFEEVYGESYEEPSMRYPDTSRLESVLGWTPEKTLHDIIDDIVHEHQSARLTEVQQGT